MALGKRRMRDISLAHSYSGFTAFDRPRASRRNSVWLRYPVSRMRAMTCFVPSFRADMPQTMFISSLRVEANTRSAVAAPASRRVSALVALPSTQMTSRLLDTMLILAASLSTTVISCPSAARMAAAL